jgi:hypothetical protein
MIIITPEKFNNFNLLPSRFEYFSLNPEINQLYNLQKVELENLFSSDYLNRLISFQKELYFTELPNKILPNSLKYDLNFRFTKRLFIESLKSQINKQTGEEVIFIDEFRNHKSLRVHFAFLYSKINIYLNLKLLITIFVSLFQAFILIFKKNFNLFITSKVQAKNIQHNLKNLNRKILNSNNIFNSNTISLESLIFIYRVFAFPFDLIDLIHTKIRYKGLLKKLNTSSPYIYLALSKYNFSKFLRKIFKFKLYTISNYGISEALNYTGTLENNFIINHGVYYFDENNNANLFWRFHSLTMINSLNSKILSNNYKDLEFIQNNNLNISYDYKENTLREHRKKIIPKNEKIILIADTFKSHNFLRPVLYNNVFEYLDFINKICNITPKEYQIILRHRPNTMISEEFILNNNKRLKTSKNRNIYDDFVDDPIVIGYTSTVLFESAELGLRSISFDSYNRDIEFLNFPLYNKEVNPSKRFTFNVKGKQNLKNLLCKI